MPRHGLVYAGAYSRFEAHAARELEDIQRAKAIARRVQRSLDKATALEAALSSCDTDAQRAEVRRIFSR